jgi:hypothetical protein
MRQSRLVIRADGESYGRDPRQITPAEFAALGFEPQPLLKVIREKCLDCCCGQQSETLKCTAVDCALWPYRMRTNPLRTGARKGNPEALQRARLARKQTAAVAH